jgi:predicted RND superfamily exporter protein
MNSPSSAIVRWRKPILVLTALATIWFGLQLRHLKIDTDVLNYLPNSDPEVQRFKESGERFGSNYIVMTALEADDIFAPAALEAVRNVTKSIEAVRGVANVLSLTNVLDMQKEAHGIVAKPLLPDGPVPTDAAWLARLRKSVLGNPTYRGNLVSPDGKVALLTIRLEEKANKQETARQIKDAARGRAGGFTLYFGGFSMIMDYMSRVISGDMSVLAPAVVLLVALALYFGFGGWRGVALPLGAVFLATIWTVGAMARLHLPLNMMTSAGPVVLVAMGAACSIYLIARFDEAAAAGAAPPEAAAVGLRAVGWPIALTAATTAIGFITLLTASLTIFGQFGEMMAMGAIFAALLSLTFVPAVLASLSPRAPRPPHTITVWAIDRPLAGARYLLQRQTTTVLVAAGLIAAASLASIPHISRNVNLLTYFPPGSEPRVSEQLLMQKFGGSQLFLVEYSAPSVKHPAVLQAMSDLERRLRTVPRVNYPNSAADVFRLARTMIEDRPGLPDTTAGADALWVLLQGQPGLDQFIDGSTQNAVVMARIDSVDNAVLGEVMTQVQRLLDDAPAEVAYVEPARFNDDVRRALEAVGARRIARNARWTLQFHGDKNPPPLETLAEQLGTIVEQPVDLSAEKRQALFARLLDYFRGEESDIQLDSETLAAAAANAIVALPRFDAPAIKDALRKAIPANIQAADPKGIDYAAPTILSRLKDLADEARLAAAFGAVQKLTGIDLGDAAVRQLADDLRADLASVNDSFVAVPANQFKTIAGRRPEVAERFEMKTSLTGWPPLSVKFDKALIATMAESIVASAAVIFLLLALQLRSLIGGLLAASPIFVNLLTTFGVMSALAIPLDNSTMMIASIAMGIGVGYTIQFIARLRLELQAGRELAPALDATLVAAGRPILINSLAVGLGFLALVLSAMTPQKRFGSLIALTMVFSAVAALTVLPAIFLRLRPAFLRRETRTKS